MSREEKVGSLAEIVFSPGLKLISTVVFWHTVFVTLSQLAEPLWTGSGLQSENSVRKLIST